MIGFHLMIDGVTLGDIDGDTISLILSELPSLIGMSILAGPIVVEGKPENPGWTGFVIIDKSHIAVHTFDIGNVVSVDVYSCKPFDDDKVLSYFKDKLHLSTFKVKMLKRTE